MSYCLINWGGCVVLHGSGRWREQPPPSPHHHLPAFYFLPLWGANLLSASCIEHSETLYLHAHPIKLDALRLVIKGIDPLNLYELQFVPAARPVRGLRKAGTSAEMCACCFAVVKERGKGFYSSSSERLTSREEAVWQQKQVREGLQHCWWLHANLHSWMLHKLQRFLSLSRPGKDSLKGCSSTKLYLFILCSACFFQSFFFF